MFVRKPNTYRLPSGLWVAQIAPTPSTVAVPPELKPNPQGFLVVGQPPSDADVMYASADLEGLELNRMSDAEIIDCFRDLPFEASMVVLAVLLGGVWHAGVDKEAHTRLARQVYRDRPILDRVLAFQRHEPNRVIFNDHYIEVAQRLVVQHAKDADTSTQLTDDEIDRILIGLLAIGSLIGEQQIALEGIEPTQADWIPMLVRTGIHHVRPDIGSEIARAYAVLDQLPSASDADGPNWCPVGDWFDESGGPVAAQVAFGFAVAAKAGAMNAEPELEKRRPFVEPEQLLTGTGLEAMAPKLFAVASATRGELLEVMSRDTSSAGVVWDRSAFERYPLLTLANGSMLLLGPRYVQAWYSEGFYHRALAVARSKPGRKKEPNAAPRFQRFYGELTEKYVLNLTTKSHVPQASSGLVRVSGERIYTGRDGSESRSPDVTLDYLIDVVTVEVASGRLSLRSKTGDSETFLEEFRLKVVAKIAEVQRATLDVVDGLVSPLGIDSASVKRAWPVVVVPSVILQSSLVWDWIRTEIPESFPDARIQLPTLLGIEDYENFMSIIESGKPLPALLTERSNGLFRDMSPSHFLVHRYSNVARPRSVDDRLDELMKKSHQILYPDGEYKSPRNELSE